LSDLILIVDDDPVHRRLIEAALQRFGYRVVVADGALPAIAILERDGAGVGAIVLDLVMPGMDGLALLDRLREMGIAAPVIVQTAQGGIDTVVQAMRRGAFDFVVKPAAPERLRTAVAGALKVEARAVETRRGGKPGPSAGSFSDIVTRSPAMERVLGLARRAAASGIPVLIEGESGVGKELVARAIQSASDRRGKPFVTVNCGAIPENLVETILFGHEKGAFTGAVDKHVGKFVEANGGTLFLDEVGDLPLDVQVKLLRAVQQGEVEPVGGRGTARVDIRIISATNRDLAERVRAGAFREDLYYRLNVLPITVPPLRQRRGDIGPLARHFLQRFSAAETGGRVRGFTPAALALLEAFDWPGNIRQLENAIFRACVLCEGDLATENEFPQIRAEVEGTVDLDFHEAPIVAQSRLDDDDFEALEDGVIPAAGMLRVVDDGGDIRTLADIEIDMIRLAIDHYDGQMSEVARRLGIGRSTLYRKLKEYGIDPDATRAERLAS